MAAMVISMSYDYNSVKNKIFMDNIDSFKPYFNSVPGSGCEMRL
jgi:hypothetical protein